MRNIMRLTEECVVMRFTPIACHESLCILSWISRCPMKFPSLYKRNSLGKPAAVCIALSDDCAECFPEVHNCNVAWERIFTISFSFTMYLLSQYPERVKTIWVLFTDLLLGGNHGFRIIIHHFYRHKTWSNTFTVIKPKQQWIMMIIRKRVMCFHTFLSLWEWLPVATQPITSQTSLWPAPLGISDYQSCIYFHQICWCLHHFSPGSTLPGCVWIPRFSQAVVCCLYLLLCQNSYTMLAFHQQMRLKDIAPRRTPWPSLADRRLKKWLPNGHKTSQLFPSTILLNVGWPLPLT